MNLTSVFTIEEIRNRLQKIPDNYCFNSKKSSFRELPLSYIIKTFDNLILMDIKYFYEFKDHPFWKNFKSKRSHGYFDYMLMNKVYSPWIKKFIDEGYDLNFKFDTHLSDHLDFNNRFDYLKKQGIVKIEENINNRRYLEKLLNEGNVSFAKIMWENGFYLDILNNDNLSNNFIRNCKNISNIENDLCLIKDSNIINKKIYYNMCEKMSNKFFRDEKRLQAFFELENKLKQKEYIFNDYYIKKIKSFFKKLELNNNVYDYLYNKILNNEFDNKTISSIKKIYENNLEKLNLFENIIIRIELKDEILSNNKYKKRKI